MDNIYEFGCPVTQTDSNNVYGCFKQSKNIYTGNDVSDDEDKDIKKMGTKITGIIAAEVFRKNIKYILEKNNLENTYKVSENNVYIKNYDTEFDFLILRKNAQKMVIDNIENSNISIELPIYNLNDVVAVLESKTYGVYSLYKGRTENTKKEIEKNDLYGFVSTYKELRKNNNNIKIGYMCLAEQRPNKGVSNFIEKTLYFFEDYFEQKYGDSNRFWYTYFSRCHFANKTTDIYATDDAWEEFVMNLVR